MDFLKGANGEAKLLYSDAEIDIIEAGAYVVCAVTGKRILLEDLKYWNVERQEAYIDAEAATKGFGFTPRSKE